MMLLSVRNSFLIEHKKNYTSMTNFNKNKKQIRGRRNEKSIENHLIINY